MHWQGHISRQEAVSMIPPLLLDVQSDSRVSALSVIRYINSVFTLEMIMCIIM